MRKRKMIRLMVFQEYETAAFAEYLKEMAGKGWYLKRIYSSNILLFEQGEPRQLTFCVAVLPGSSQFDDPDREAAVAFREICEETGWKLQYGGVLWQIFYSEEENPVPIESDPQIQLETQKEISLSLGKWGTAIAISLLFLFQLRFTFGNPGRHLASVSTLCITGCSLLIAVLFPLKMLYTLWWFKKAERRLEQGCPLPVTTLRRVRLKNHLWCVGSVALILTLILQSGMSVSRTVICLVIASLAILICSLVLTWVQEHSTGDRREAVMGYFVGAFILGWLGITLVSGVLFQLFPEDEYENRHQYVRREPFPVTFEELGYQETDEWSRESEKSFLAFYQTETGERMEADGKESHVTMTYYRSPVSAVIAGTKRNYPIDRGNVWKVTASKSEGEDGVTVEHYRYSMKDRDSLVMEGWDSGDRDLYVISDRNRILTLEYSTATDKTAVTAAVAGFSVK